MEGPGPRRAPGRDRLDPPDDLHPVLQLGEVDELEVEGEGADQPRCRRDVDLTELPVQGPADRVVVTIAELLGLGPDLLLQLEQLLALLLGQGLAEQGADQSDVAAEAPVGLALGRRARWVVLLGHP